MRHTLLALVAASLLVGCAQPEPVASETPDPGLGVAPVVTDVEPAPPVTTGAGPGATPSPDAAPAAPAQPDDATPSPTPSPSLSSSPDVAGPRPSPTQDSSPVADTTQPLVLLAVDDAAGDHGLEGPAWVDLRSVEVVELGNDLRVTLRFAGALPTSPPDGEVPLIGVDIGEGDGAHQLFVEGGGQAWAAYLRTPDGFVPYPGTFELAGRAMVLQVPFNAVGSPLRAPVSVLVEWSQDRPVLNAVAEDPLDGQPHQFDRSP